MIRKMIILMTLSLISSSVFAEKGDSRLNQIRLKSRIFTPEQDQIELMSVASAPRHLILQFSEQITPERVDELKLQGIQIVGFVPNNAVVASVPAGVSLNSADNVRWAGSLTAEDKLSQKIARDSGSQYALVDIFSDIDPYVAEQRMKNTGIEIIPNIYLNKHTFLIKGDAILLQSLAELDMVSYIYPAAEAIIQGKPVRQCAGARTPYGMILNFVTEGEGWDGPGQNAVDLFYYFVNGTPDMLDEDIAVRLALQTWAHYIDITWSEASFQFLPGTIDISWSAGFHGDFDPFDGASGTLAHAFYPPLLVPEPLAGDIHFDEDEMWTLGTLDPTNSMFDLYSVALHEAGHSLGLNHSDDTDAVMFAFAVQTFGDLRQDDLDGIQSLYKDRDFTRTPTPVLPLPISTESPQDIYIGYGAGSDASDTFIYFTIDSTDPGYYSDLMDPIRYSDPPTNFLRIRETTTIKARAYRSGDAPSLIAQQTYVIEPATPMADEPNIEPHGGIFVESVRVTLSTGTDGADIYYTTDGSEPDESSNQYSRPFELTSSATLKARAFHDDFSPSTTASAYFEVFEEITAPTLFPAGGIGTEPFLVTMATEIPGAEIRFTTNGTEPTEQSFLYIGPNLIQDTIELKAKAFFAGEASETTTEYYIIGTKADRPTITPNGGDFTGPVQVTLATTTPGAEIRYTTNGFDPTPYSTLYDGPFTLNVGSHVVQARAYFDGLEPSDEAGAIFEVYNPDAGTVEDPTMTPFSSQQFVNNFPVTMDCRTEGATIRWTLGIGQLPQDPPETGPGAVTYTEPFTFGEPGFTYFFKIRAFKDGLNPSNVIQTGGLQVNEPVGQVETPTFTPNGGTFHNQIQVAIESATPSAQIVYTRDGSEPDSFLPILPPTFNYNNPINIFQPMTIKAKAFRTFFEDSDTASAEFIFKCATPTITPESGTHIGSVEVTLATETTGGNTAIYYTLDGSDPNDSTIKYEEPFTLDPGTYSLRAKATRANFLDSEVTSAEFHVPVALIAPQITQQPQSQEAVLGSDVIFTVSATGQPTPVYEWQVNGAPIPGVSDSTLHLPNVQEGDAGSYRVIASNQAGADTSEYAILTVDAATSVSSDNSHIPEDFQLDQNYPNPFNPTTHIRFALPERSRVTLKIYNLLGREVITLVDDEYQAGTHVVTFDAGELASGVYVYRIHSREFIATRKLILLR